MDSGSLARSELLVCGCSSTNTDSITTGGGLVFRRSSAGFTVARPLMVGNQSFPSLLRQAAGCEPEVHSTVGKPSGLPKARAWIQLVSPSAQSFKSFFETRTRPALDPIHK